MRTLLASLAVLTAVPLSAAAAPSLQVTSKAFGANESIPVEYTCEGSENSPPLAWSKVPDGTKSIAILVEDTDAPRGPFLHWLVTGIPATTTSLASGELPQGAVASKNDKGLAGYAGPCPPMGLHHYHFRVYALDIPLSKAMTRQQFTHAMKGHVLEEGALTGTFQAKTDR